MSIYIGKYNFVQTCCSCPEQYDVFDENGKQVCYIRLRWGSLYAQYPDVGGVDIYEASVGDGWTGNFPSEQERQRHLRAIAKEVDKYVNYDCSNCDYHDWEEKDDLGFARVMICGNPYSVCCDQVVDGKKICKYFCNYGIEDDEEYKWI